MKRKLLSLIVGAALLAPSLVSAIELGAVKIRSKGGAALRADIPISSKKLSNDVSLMLDAQTAKQGRRILNSLNVSVVKRNGRSYVRLTSDKPINESVLEFSLRLIAPEGSAARRYVINLPQTSHLPKVRRVRQAQKMHLGGKAVASKQKTKKTTTAATVSKKPKLPKNLKVANLKGGFYGPVRGGETLLNIATKTRPSKSISLNDMVQAIRVANPNTTSPLQIDTKLFIPTIKGYAPYRGKTNNQPEEITVDNNETVVAYDDTSMRPVLIEQQTVPVETPVVDDTAVSTDASMTTEMVNTETVGQNVAVDESSARAQDVDLMNLSTAETVAGDIETLPSSSNVRIISSLSETQADSDAVETTSQPQTAVTEETTAIETPVEVAPEATVELTPVETPIVLESTATDETAIDETATVEAGDNSQETLAQASTETTDVVEETEVESSVSETTEITDTNTSSEMSMEAGDTPIENAGSLVDKITGSLLILLSIFAIVGGWLFLIKPRKKGKKDLKQATTVAIAAGKTTPEPTPVIDEGHVEGWSVSTRKVASDDVLTSTETLDEVHHVDGMDNDLLTPVIETTGSNEPQNGIDGVVNDWAISAKKNTVAVEENLPEATEEEKLAEITLEEISTFADLPGDDELDTVIDSMVNEDIIDETLTPQAEIAAEEAPTEEAVNLQEFSMDIDIDADDIVRFEPSAQHLAGDSDDSQPQDDYSQASLTEEAQVEDNVDYDELVANLLPKEDLEQIELDLAQASEIPMAKSDYAKALLEEIVARGDDEQAENAQKLLNSLAG